MEPQDDAKVPHTHSVRRRNEERVMVSNSYHTVPHCRTKAAVNFAMELIARQYVKIHKIRTEYPLVTEPRVGCTYAVPSCCQGA